MRRPSTLLSSTLTPSETQYAGNTAAGIDFFLSSEEGSYNMAEVNDEDFDGTVLEKKGLSVVYFTSQGWCKTSMTQNLQEVISKESGNARFFHIDTDKNFEVATNYNIRFIPSTIIFKDGQMVAEIVGAVPPSVVSNQIHKHLNYEFL